VKGAVKAKGARRFGLRSRPESRAVDLTEVAPEDREAVKAIMLARGDLSELLGSIEERDGAAGTLHYVVQALHESLPRLRRALVEMQGRIMAELQAATAGEDVGPVG